MLCFAIPQHTDKKGIREEMQNNSARSVLEQKVKRRNTLHNCNRTGLQTARGLAQPRPGAQPRSSREGIPAPGPTGQRQDQYQRTGAPQGKLGFYYLPSSQNFTSKSLVFCFFFRAIPFFSFSPPLFRATPAACGSSQARGRIGAVAAGLCYSRSNVGSKPHLQPTPQLVAMLDP